LDFGGIFVILLAIVFTFNVIEKIGMDTPIKEEGAILVTDYEVLL
jgi:hypothetical protein